MKNRQRDPKLGEARRVRNLRTARPLGLLEGDGQAELTDPADVRLIHCDSVAQTPLLVLEDGVLRHSFIQLTQFPTQLANRLVDHEAVGVERQELRLERRLVGFRVVVLQLFADFVKLLLIGSTQLLVRDHHVVAVAILDGKLADHDVHVIQALFGIEVSPVAAQRVLNFRRRLAVAKRIFQAVEGHL